MVVGDSSAKCAEETDIMATVVNVIMRYELVVTESVCQMNIM